MYKQTAQYLSARACPSIAYRIRKEILNDNISNSDMQVLQSRILKEDEIKNYMK